MPTYHLFGADESYTVIEFDDGDTPGQYASWDEVKAAAIKAVTDQLNNYPKVFVQDLRYVRMRKLLHHLRQCAQFSDYQWGIKYKAFMSPDAHFPLQ